MQAPLPPCLRRVGTFIPSSGCFAGHALPLYEADDIRVTLLYQRVTSKWFRDALRRASLEDLRHCKNRILNDLEYEPGRLYAIQQMRKRAGEGYETHLVDD
jgi:hypothetical protein